MRQFTKIEKEAPIDFENFRIHMQREMILRKLKEGGYRITKQRIAVIDIILENDCGSCKEILYKTSKINKKIGTATVYRTLNMLEEIGAINRRNLYKFSERSSACWGPTAPENPRCCGCSPGSCPRTAARWTSAPL